MKEVERPPPVLVASLNHDFDGFTDAPVGFDSCISQIIESAQDVVVPKRREREAAIGPKPPTVARGASSPDALQPFAQRGGNVTFTAAGIAHVSQSGLVLVVDFERALHENLIEWRRGQSVHSQH